MNREIKFRGKRVDNGEWVYGCLINNMWTYSELTEREGKNVCEIITGKYEGDCWEDAVAEDECIVTVIPETVGQYTGIRDKDGKEVFEGHIVEAIFNYHGKESDIKFNAKIVYNNDIGSFQISYKNKNDSFVNDGIYLKYFLKVIGESYENPELL